MVKILLLTQEIQETQVLSLGQEDTLEEEKSDTTKHLSTAAAGWAVEVPGGLEPMPSPSI